MPQQICSLFPELKLKMGAKIPQQSSSRPWLHPAVTTYYESYLKTAHQIRRPEPPIFIDAHIQLAGDDLANNHTFKLLSGLLQQTLHKRNIALTISPVNPKSFF